MGKDQNKLRGKSLPGRTAVRAVCAIALLFVFSSCATTRSHFSRLDSDVSQHRFVEAIDHLERNRDRLYSNRDTILYYLDRGMLSHWARMHGESIRLLTRAEEEIEAAFTVSVTQVMATFLINDTLRDYPGEDFEDIYINIFNALNFFHMGMLESAMVEIRRMNLKLMHLATKYSVMMSELQQRAMQEDFGHVPFDPSAPVNFSDSALARYLSMLFYRAAGMEDDVRIASEWLRVAFANAPAVYNFPIPSTIVYELYVPRGVARLNVLAFSGLAPIKESSTMRIPLPGMRWARIDLPHMVSRRSEVASIYLVHSDGQRIRLELLEDIEAVAMETFRARRDLIYLKTVMRAITKAAGSVALGVAANEASGDTALVLGVASILAQVFAETSERADLRTSRFFPGRAYVTGINLEPGVHSFDVVFYNRAGRRVAIESFHNFVVRENALNLVEAFHLN
ncbi:MAG: hypothetical protein FWG66_11760 [Spirochaetes bacterium]|nr:hypothetical protein [Spirochaetota bacterium]